MTIRFLSLSLFICLTGASMAQSKAKFMSKDKFSMPLSQKYSILINSKLDTLYSYYSIFERAFEKSHTGIYVEIEKTQVVFQGSLLAGRLNGVYIKYSWTGTMVSYGKYVNDVLIEKNEIVYDNETKPIKIKTEKERHPILRK